MNRIKMKVTLPVSVVWLTICTMLSTVHVWFYFLTGLRVASYSHISKHGITSSDGRWCFSMVKENSLTAKIQSKFPSGPSSKVSIKIKKVTKKEQWKHDWIHETSVTWKNLVDHWTIRMTPKDLLFCSVFVVELLLRIYAYGRRFFSMSLGRFLPELGLDAGCWEDAEFYIWKLSVFSEMI